MQENNDLPASVHNLQTSSTVFELNQENGTWSLRFNFLFSIRTKLEEPQWLGDTLHISQGSGIKTWEVTNGSLRAFLDYGRATHGSAWLSLPGKLRSVSVNGRSVSAGMIEPGIIKIDIRHVQDVRLEISWSEASS